MFKPRTISVAIDKIARVTVGKDWSLYSTLLERWPEIVGAEYARLTTPVKIAFPPRQNEARRTGGTLTIRLPKGLAMEFTFQVDRIRQRITDYFGYEAIVKILLDTTYILPPEPEPAKDYTPDPEILADIRETAKEIADDELRQALEALCESVLRATAK